MKDWEPYIRAGFEVVQDAKSFAPVYLAPDVEAYLVHMFARTIERVDIGEKPIAIQVMEAQQIPRGYLRKPKMRDIGEECLFIDAWEIKSSRWPTREYFKDMGSMAFGMAAVAVDPVDDLLDLVSNHFHAVSSVLRAARDMSR